MNNYSKAKRKKYFSSNLMAKKNRDLFVKFGLKGFLCTCNGYEKQCIRESYNLLNEYADKLFGEEKLNKSEEPDESQSSTSVGDDVMDEFQKEVDAMKSQTAKKTRRFQALDTSIINCIFVETTVDDPVSLIHSIMADLFETKQKKVRFLLRMVPIEITCRAYMDELEKAAQSVFDKYFKEEPTTYAIVYNKRHNSNLERDTVIEKLASIVQEKNNEHKVNLTNPNLTIIVEVMKSVCGIAVVRDYFRFSKYNLHTICGIDKADIEKAILEKDDDDGKNIDGAGDPPDKVESAGDSAVADKAEPPDSATARIESCGDDCAVAEKAEPPDSAAARIESSGDDCAVEKIETPDSTTVGDAADTSAQKE